MRGQAWEVCNADCLQLTEREAEVCSVICFSPNPVPFSALKRQLGYHQEVVSRILKRLVNYGAIAKVGGGYVGKPVNNYLRNAGPVEVNSVECCCCNCRADCAAPQEEETH